MPPQAGGHRVELDLFEFVPGEGVRVAGRAAGTPLSGGP